MPPIGRFLPAAGTNGRFCYEWIGAPFLGCREEPITNEPGHEKDAGSDTSRAYNLCQSYNTMVWAMRPVLKAINRRVPGHWIRTALGLCQLGIADGQLALGVHVEDITAPFSG